MRRIVLRMMMGTVLMSAGAFSAGQETLDPSIFDGTGREQREASEETGSQEPSPPVEGEGAMGEEDELPAEPGAGAGVEEGSTEDTPAAEEEMGAVGGEEQDEGMPEEPASPGSPAEVMTESRAGERVESTEKIAPGQAVDFPWDM